MAVISWGWKMRLRQAACGRPRAALPLSAPMVRDTSRILLKSPCMASPELVQVCPTAIPVLFRLRLDLRLFSALPSKAAFF
jgi:hypothetical protein